MNHITVEEAAVNTYPAHPDIVLDTIGTLSVSRIIDAPDPRVVAAITREVANLALAEEALATYEYLGGIHEAVAVQSDLGQPEEKTRPFAYMTPTETRMLGAVVAARTLTETLESIGSYGWDALLLDLGEAEPIMTDLGARAEALPSDGAAAVARRYLFSSSAEDGRDQAHTFLDDEILLAPAPGTTLMQRIIASGPGWMERLHEAILTGSASEADMTPVDQYNAGVLIVLGYAALAVRDSYPEPN